MKTLKETQIILGLVAMAGLTALTTACGNTESIRDYKEVARNSKPRPEAGPRGVLATPTPYPEPTPWPQPTPWPEPTPPAQPTPWPEPTPWAQPTPWPKPAPERISNIYNIIFPAPLMKAGEQPTFFEGETASRTLSIFTNLPKGVEVEISAQGAPAYAKLAKKSGSDYTLTVAPPLGTAIGDILPVPFKIVMKVLRTPDEKTAARMNEVLKEHPFTITVVKTKEVPSFKEFDDKGERVVQEGQSIEITGTVQDLGALNGETPKVAPVASNDRSSERPSVNQSLRYLQDLEVQPNGRGQFSFRARVDLSGYQLPSGQKEAYVRFGLLPVSSRGRVGPEKKVEIKVVKVEAPPAPETPVGEPAAGAPQKQEQPPQAQQQGSKKPKVKANTKSGSRKVTPKSLKAPGGNT